MDLLSKIGSSSPNAFILILSDSIEESIRVFLILFTLSLDKFRLKKESPSSDEWPSIRPLNLYLL